MRLEFCVNIPRKRHLKGVKKRKKPGSSKTFYSDLLACQKASAFSGVFVILSSAYKETQLKIRALRWWDKDIRELQKDFCEFTALFEK